MGRHWRVKSPAPGRCCTGQASNYGVKVGFQSGGILHKNVRGNNRHRNSGILFRQECASVSISYTCNVSPGAGIHPDDITFYNKIWNGNFCAGLDGDFLGYTGGGIPFNRNIRPRHL